MTEARPEKSENKPAGDDVTEVAPGVLRVMLPIAMPGLGHVNCYVLTDARGITLVDPGLADGVTHDVLTQRLADVDLDIRRVHTAVITHSHHDHFGGVTRLLSLDTIQPVAVVAHASFGRSWSDAYGDLAAEDSSSWSVRDGDDALIEVAERFVRPTRWGTMTDPAPIDYLRTLADGIGLVGALRPPKLTVAVKDGERIRLGGTDWLALHTPGHADDHLCLYDEANGTLLGGDHLLPTITPHISGLSEYDDPLQTFFDSLHRIHGLSDVKIALPAHGDPFENVGERVTAIREHHDGRLDKLIEIHDAQGPGHTEHFMKHLFRERSWGSMAASETYAHLEWLRIHGPATRTEVDGRPFYNL